MLIAIVVPPDNQIMNHIFENIFMSYSNIKSTPVLARSW